MSREGSCSIYADNADNETASDGGASTAHRGKILDVSQAKVSRQGKERKRKEKEGGKEGGRKREDGGREERESPRRRRVEGGSLQELSQGIAPQQ